MSQALGGGPGSGSAAGPERLGPLFSLLILLTKAAYLILLGF